MRVKVSSPELVGRLVAYLAFDSNVVVTQLADAGTITQVDTLLTDEGTIVTLHCAYPPDTPLSEVHTAMARLERDLRRAVPDIVRVQIDPEPIEMLQPVGEKT